MDKGFFQITNLEKHQDERGVLVEILKSNQADKPINQIYSASIMPGKERGGHYHKKKTEWFFLCGGSCEAWLYNTRTGEKEVIKISEQDKITITIPPFTAHFIKNTSDKAIYLLSATDHIFDPSNTDTYKYEP